MVDALSLAAVQPEAAAASELTRAEVKAATRAAAHSIGHDLTEQGTEVAAAIAAKGALEETAATTTQHLARWWSVRMAGGTYAVLRRMPEALPRLGLTELTDLGRPLCAAPASV